MAGTRPTRNSSGQFIKKQPVVQIQQHSAQVLLQKPAPVTAEATEAVAVAVTSQQVNVEQSLQLVQTTLHACLAHILFQRSLYPQTCYQSRYFNPDGPEWSYKDSFGGEDRAVNIPGGSVIFSLKKGVSERTDRLLDLLENGIFDALGRGYLKSVHLSIFEDDKNPTDVFETWTLTVDYIPGPNGTRVASGLNITDQQGTSTKVTLNRVKHSLNAFIRQLTGQISGMPTLPAKKFINLEMGYTEDRPQDYVAPGFHHPVYDTVRFPSNDDWRKATTTVGLLHTGHHAAGLTVSHLHSLNPDIDDELPLPAGLECIMEIGKTDDVLHDLRDRATALLAPRARPTTSRRADLSPLEDAAMPDVHTPRTRERSIKLARVSTRDQQEREQLRDMLSRPERTSNMQETQPVDVTNSESQAVNTAARLIVRQSKLDEVAREADTAQKPRPERMVLLTSHQHLEAVTVRCICNHSEEEGDIVQCGYCALFQHLHCHGYAGKNDPRLPAVHICYSCLLTSEDDTLHQVQQQAYIRRALYLLQEGSFEDSKSLSQALGCSDKTVAMVKKELNKSGLLNTNLGPNRKDKIRLVFSSSPTAREVMERKFFNPISGIAHYASLEDFTELDERSSVTVTNAKRALEEVDLSLAPEKRLKQFGGATWLNADDVHTPKAPRRHRT